MCVYVASPWPHLCVVSGMPAALGVTSMCCQPCTVVLALLVAESDPVFVGVLHTGLLHVVRHLMLSEMGAVCVYTP